MLNIFELLTKLTEKFPPPPDRGRHAILLGDDPSTLMLGLRVPDPYKPGEALFDHYIFDAEDMKKTADAVIEEIEHLMKTRVFTASLLQVRPSARMKVYLESLKGKLKAKCGFKQRRRMSISAHIATKNGNVERIARLLE